MRPTPHGSCRLLELGDKVRVLLARMRAGGAYFLIEPIEPAWNVRSEDYTIQVPRR